MSVLALVCLAAGGAAAMAADRAGGAKNVVLMVADGAGFNAWQATAMYEGTQGHEFHDRPGWVRLAVSTHALRLHEQSPVSAAHGLTQLPALVYDPARVWDPTPEPGEQGAYPHYFAGYKWLRQTASDSAATMSAMVTGLKTYVGSINVDGNGQPVTETAAALAHARGKRVGIVTSVLFAGATPSAAAGAHQADREAYCELAVEMLTSPYPDLIAGCGHPDYDNNAEPIRDPADKNYAYVGGKEVWELLTGTGRLEVGQQVCVRPVAGGGVQATVLTGAQVAALEAWTLLQSRTEIESLLKRPPPEKLLMVPRVGEIAFQRGGLRDADDDDFAYVSKTAVGNGAAKETSEPSVVRIGGTLQQQRGSRADPRYTAPGYDPPLARVPSLETLTRVALDALDDDEDGFFLHVEGGAVDWAMHDNQLGRAIEELMDFKRSVEAVTEWVEGHGGWDETLLIVTADHDHLLWGPEADSVPFDPLRDNGKGRLPLYRWLWDDHSNALVPLYARGVESERFESLARSEDPFYGRYVDQTDVFTVIRAALQTSHQP